MCWLLRLCTWVFLLARCVRTDGRLRLSLSCPRQYTVQRADADDIEIIIAKQNSTMCSRTLRGPAAAKVSPTDDLDPSMDIYQADGAYYVNITWTAKVTDNRYPRRFYLNLVAKWRDRNDALMTSQTCVVLRLGKRKSTSSQRPATFFYDCVRLVPEPDTHLYAQVWSLPGNVGRRSCRNARSLDPHSCPGLESSIQCSRESIYPLSIDLHKSRICLCGDEQVRGSMVKVRNGSIQATVGHLPPFTKDIRAVIFREYRHETVFDEILEPTNESKETIEFTTNKRATEGNYSLEIYVRCPAKDDNDIFTPQAQCRLNGAGTTFPSVLEVPVKKTVDGEPTDWNIIVGVLAAVLLTSIIVVVIFLMKQARTRASSNSGNCRGNNIPEIVNGSETMELVSLLQRNIIETPSQLASTSRDTHDTERHHQHDSNTPYTSTKKGEAEHTQDNETPNPTGDVPIIMLLCHPDNQPLEDAVNDVCRLMAKFDIVLERGSESPNWRDFAESVGSDIHNIVIMMSHGLTTLCHEYLDRGACNRDEFNNLLRERFREYIPCVALDKLRTIVENNPNGNNVYIHIVSLGHEPSTFENFTETFLNDHHFIVRSHQNQYYKLATVDNDDSDKTVDLNQSDITRLVYNLCNDALTRQYISETINTFIISDNGVSFKTHVHDVYNMGSKEMVASEKQNINTSDIVT